MGSTLAIPTKAAARKMGQGPTANDELVAAEWNLTLRTVCSNVTGIYKDRFKLADYCHDTSRLIIGSDTRHVVTLFDAIIAIGNLAAVKSDRLPSWLRV